MPQIHLVCPFYVANVDMGAFILERILLYLGFVMSGEFEFGQKCWDSFKVNMIFYGCSLLALVLVVIILVTQTSVNTSEAVTGLLMAISNAFGMLILIIFLGYGLIEVPRSLWKSADHKRSLMRLEYLAPFRKERLVEAETELVELLEEVSTLSDRAKDNPTVQPYVDELIKNTPVVSPSSPTSAAELKFHNRPVSKAYLITLNYAVKEAIVKRNRQECQWNNLIQQAFHLQDVINNEFYHTDHLWTSSLERPDPKPWRRALRWYWNVWFDSWWRRIVAILFVILSAVIVWSEASVLCSSLDVSPIYLIVHWNNLDNTVVEMFTLVVLVYLGGCAYSSFMKLRILSYFRLQAHHHTDEKSLLFFAAYFSRLVFPLGYNYLTLIEGLKHERKLRTEFSKVPDDYFATLNRSIAPVALSIVCVIVVFRGHNLLLRKFKLSSAYHFEDFSGSHEHLIEGRELIHYARRVEERMYHRSADNFYTTSMSRSRLASNMPLDESNSSPATTVLHLHFSDHHWKTI